MIPTLILTIILLVVYAIIFFIVLYKSKKKTKEAVYPLLSIAEKVKTKAKLDAEDLKPDDYVLTSSSGRKYIMMLSKKGNPYRKYLN